MSTCKGANSNRCPAQDHRNQLLVSGYRATGRCRWLSPMRERNQLHTVEYDIGAKNRATSLLFEGVDADVADFGIFTCAFHGFSVLTYWLFILRFQ
jgi:hypothetical protein